MSDKNSNDVFDLLNSEFASFELEKENARNLEALRRRQAIRQQIAYQQQNDEQDDDDEEEDEGTGCVGVTFRILLIIILAGALAWIVFMPEGSLKELWDKYSPKVSSTFSWVSGLISGEKKSGDRVNPEIITTSDIKNSENDDVSDIAEDAAYAGTDTEQSDDSSAQDIAASDSPYNITVYRPSQIVLRRRLRHNDGRRYSHAHLARLPLLPSSETIPYGRNTAGDSWSATATPSTLPHSATDICFTQSPITKKTPERCPIPLMTSSEIPLRQAVSGFASATRNGFSTTVPSALPCMFRMKTHLPAPSLR